MQRLRSIFVALVVWALAGASAFAAWNFGLSGAVAVAAIWLLFLASLVLQ